MIATRIMVHATTVRIIMTDATIVIKTMIAMLATDKLVKTSKMHAAIMTMIARAIAIVITRIASMIKATAIKKPITILDQSMVPKRTIMPCTLLLAAT